MSYVPPPSNLEPGSLVDAYLRDSGGEGQDRSVASQLLEVQSYCRTYQLILRNIYKDTKSGKSIVGRHDFDRMIDDVQLAYNNPQGILLWDYARFARNTKDAVFHIALIENQGIVVHSLTDEIPDGEFRDLIRYVKHLGNEAERKKNSAAVKREMHQLVKFYKAMFGTPPRGFMLEPLPPILNERTGEYRSLNKWVPDPDWTHRIQQAFSLKASGSTLIEIHQATHIYNEFSSYRRFFSNKIYIGILEFGGETFDDYCDPIVDRKTWDAVQKILALHSNHQHVSSLDHHPRRKAAAATYLLSGLAHCARCGAPLWGMTSGQRNGTYYLRYACTNAKRTRTCDLQPIPAKALEQEVISKLTAFFDHPDNLAAILAEDRQQRAQLSSQNGAVLKDLNARLKKVRGSISNVTEAIAERRDKKSQALAGKLDSLEADETDLLSQIESVKTYTPTAEAPLTAAEITFVSKRLVANLQSHDKPAIRTVLHACINVVSVDRTQQFTFGTIKLHTPREPKTSKEDPPPVIMTRLDLRNTVSTTSPRVGAPLYKRSIEFNFKIAHAGRPGIKRPHF